MAEEQSTSLTLTVGHWCHLISRCV